MSQAIYIAKSIAEQIATTVWDWPVEIVPTTPDRLDTVVPVDYWVMPIFDRTAMKTPQVAVCPMVVRQGLKDCNRRWDYGIAICTFVTIQEAGKPKPQSANLAEIEQALTIGEEVRDFICSNKEYRNCQLVEVEMELYNEERLRADHVFENMTMAYYRYAN